MGVAVGVSVMVGVRLGVSVPVEVAVGAGNVSVGDGGGDVAGRQPVSKVSDSTIKVRRFMFFSGGVFL